MPVYLLNESLAFPPISHAEPDGVLAVGGDLSPERLLLAYSEGIFPWFNEGDPIIWHSPNPRMVLFPEDLKISKSMRPVFNRRKFSYTCDQNFVQVMKYCQGISRPDQAGTWITEDMMNAYVQLHKLGFAHSVEVWEGENLVGGLYGVSLGSCFFGESMFALKPNASKAGFIRLVRALEERGFGLIDCQVYTNHLASLGAAEIPRENFSEILRQGVQPPHLQGSWEGIFTEPFAI